jgi:hypothetical protein
MDALKVIAAIVLGIGSVVCWVIIFIDMFQNAVWKGIVGLLCGLYALYYAVFEFDHNEKLIVVIVAIFGGGLGGAFSVL